MPRLLDSRFRYVPAAATDVAATWQRFGYRPDANRRRRAAQLSRAMGAPAEDAAAFADLLARVAAARMAF